MTALFDRCLAAVIGAEGGYTSDPADPGNWTGGACGVGTCKGTAFGISAAAYPALDIRNLTCAQAATIYARDYWAPIRGDDLPPAVALAVFDGAVNSGVRQASRWLQEAVGAEPDGYIGPVTLAAVAATAKAQSAAMICAEVLALRLVADAALPGWRTYGLGWARRVTRLACRAATFA